MRQRNELRSRLWIGRRRDAVVLVLPQMSLIFYFASFCLNQWSVVVEQNAVAAEFYICLCTERRSDEQDKLLYASAMTFPSNPVAQVLAHV